MKLDAVLILKTVRFIHQHKMACLLTHALAAKWHVAKTNTHLLQILPTCLQARIRALGRLLSAGENNTRESFTGIWHDSADTLKHVCTSVHS